MLLVIDNQMLLSGIMAGLGTIAFKPFMFLFISVKKSLIEYFFFFFFFFFFFCM